MLRKAKTLLLVGRLCGASKPDPASKGSMSSLCRLQRTQTLTGNNKDLSTTPVLSFADGENHWHSIGDPIMGGRSLGEMVFTGGLAIFQGVVSLERGGGFASVRSAEGRHDLSCYEGLVIRLRGDGKHYGLRLRTTSSFDGVNYQVEFQPEASVWSDCVLPFSSFRPVLRGQELHDYPAPDPANIKSFGLIIARHQAGPFRLEVASIGGYRPRALSTEG
jgi:NADH dehydrogenase [ubiquinone] 1 alpha subcomplex assembly factor 1